MMRKQCKKAGYERFRATWCLRGYKDEMMILHRADALVHIFGIILCPCAMVGYEEVEQRVHEMNRLLNSSAVSLDQRCVAAIRSRSP